MRTKVTVDDLYRCGACDERLVGLFAFLESQNIPRDGEMDFDEVIALFNANRLRHFSYWLEVNRATLLEYTKVHKEVYVVNGVEYATLEEASVGLEMYKAERRAYHHSLSSVAFTQALDEDHVWQSVDIDTFVVPENCLDFHFHVFDHTTGLHSEAYSIEEARAKRDALIEQFIASESVNFEVRKRIYYQENEGTYKDVAL